MFRIGTFFTRIEIFLNTMYIAPLVIFVSDGYQTLIASIYVYMVS